jgi:small subunit ribosomal protein S10
MFMFQVDALDGIEEMAAESGPTAKMSIVLKSFEKIRPGRLTNASKVGLPTTRILFTFNRSPHVDKKSREQFEMKTRRKLLVMKMDVAKLREKYNLLKNHNMLGVQLKVNFHYKTRLDMSRLKGPVLEASTVAQVGEDEKTKQIEEN